MAPFEGAFLLESAMWEILSSPDFRMNLLAGALFFALELLLVVLLLPALIQRRLDRRWLPTRRGFVRSLPNPMRVFLQAVELDRQFQADEKGVPGWDDWGEGIGMLQDRVQTYSACFNPEMAADVAMLLEEGRNGMHLLDNADRAAGSNLHREQAQKMKDCFKSMCDAIQRMEKAVGISDEDWRSDMERSFAYRVDGFMETHRSRIRR